MTGEKKSKPSKAAGKTASKATGKTTRKTPSKTAGKASKTTGKTSKAASKAVIRAPGKTPSKVSGRTTSRPPSRATSRPPVKPPIKAPLPQYIMSKEEWNAFIEKMEKLLQEEKSEIINTLIANNNDFKEIVDGMEPKDFADIASDDIDRKMIEMLGSQELNRLKLIESAQTRIKQGKYGHCIKCDRPIPPERLEAIPYALMCIDCKSEEERRNR